MMADIDAEVWFLPTAAGGRHHPVQSGYCGQFFYNGVDCDVIHEYPDRQWVHPGEKAPARFTFSRPDVHLPNLHPGMPFLIREGNKTIGYGIIRSTNI